MAPTLNEGDFIIVRKLGFGTYGTFGITLVDKSVSSNEMMERGEIYVFTPRNDNRPFVKRLIGLPGDSIEVTKRGIVVNGEAITQLKDNDAGDIFVCQ